MNTEYDPLAPSWPAIPRGSVLYLVAASNKTRRGSCAIRVLTLTPAIDGTLTSRDHSYSVAKLLRWKYSEPYGGVIVAGHGMNLGLHLVQSLAHALHGDENALSMRWL